MYITDDPHRGEEDYLNASLETPKLILQDRSRSIKLYGCSNCPGEGTESLEKLREYAAFLAPVKSFVDTFEKLRTNGAVQSALFNFDVVQCFFCKGSRNRVKLPSDEHQSRC